MRRTFSWGHVQPELEGPQGSASESTGTKPLARAQLRVCTALRAPAEV